MVEAKSSKPLSILMSIIYAGPSEIANTAMVLMIFIRDYCSILKAIFKHFLYLFQFWIFKSFGHQYCLGQCLNNFKSTVCQDVCMEISPTVALKFLRRYFYTFSLYFLMLNSEIHWDPKYLYRYHCFNNLESSHNVYNL